MKINRIGILFFTLMIAVSCRNDDDNDLIEVPPQTLAETLVTDDADITAYLETHFYNYEEFQTPPENFDFKIRIDTIAGDNQGKTPLSQQVMPKVINVDANRFLETDEVGQIAHTLYYLEARPGVGIQPTIADSAFVRYKGSLLDGTTFDGSTEIPVWFDLASIQGSGARGFAEGASLIKAGGEIVENEDGTFTVENYGVGLVIFPSGLGYFNVLQGSIPTYSPLIFEIDMYAMNDSDHDGDGILSIFEDINGNGFLFDDEDDTDADNFVNYFDADDDGDGTSTRDEISDENGDIILPYPDTDGDDIPDYLDPDNS